MKLFSSLAYFSNGKKLIRLWVCWVVLLFNASFMIVINKSRQLHKLTIRTTSPSLRDSSWNFRFWKYRLVVSMPASPFSACSRRCISLWSLPDLLVLKTFPHVSQHLFFLNRIASVNQKPLPKKGRIKLFQVHYKWFWPKLGYLEFEIRLSDLKHGLQMRWAGNMNEK